MFSSQLMYAILDLINIGIVVLDQDLRVIYANQFIKKAFHLIDNDLLRIDSSLNSMFNELQGDQFFIDNRIYHVIKEKKRVNNAPFTFIFLSDITDLKEKEKNNTVFRMIIDHIYEGVVASDHEGRVYIYNKAIEKMDRMNSENVLGKKLHEVYEDFSPQKSPQYQVIQSHKPITDVYENYHVSGQKVNIVTDNYPVFFEGKFIGAYSITRDITKIRALLNQTLEFQKISNIQEHDNEFKKTGGCFFHEIIGESSLFKKAVSKGKKAAEVESAVMIVGETGTGKEMFVQSIYRNSTRFGEPLIPLNCAALPESLLESLLFGTVKGAYTGAIDSAGLFEQAGKGILFLDELNSMSLSMQSKILRVLQEKTVRRVGGKREIPVNCRIISTTNQDPMECIKMGTLRQDLFYRLGVMMIVIPPLRDRKEDIEKLCQHFIRFFNDKYHTNVESISRDLIVAFMKYKWPGNVRELMNLIESAINLVENNEKQIRFEHMPYYFSDMLGEKKLSELLRKRNFSAVNIDSVNEPYTNIFMDYEEKIIMDTLIQFKGNVSRTAISLGIPRQNLNYKIKKFNIDLRRIRNS